MKYAIDLSFITGEIPLYIAQQIGYKNETFPENCMMFSDHKNDGYKPPDNQLLMFSKFDELLEPIKILETN